jgi:hypothetical protein
MHMPKWIWERQPSDLFLIAMSILLANWLLGIVRADSWLFFCGIEFPATYLLLYTPAFLYGIVLKIYLCKHPIKNGLSKILFIAVGAIPLFVIWTFVFWFFRSGR